MHARDTRGVEAAVADEILVVDDTAESLKLLEEILTGAGYRVRLANGGELALRSARIRPPALVLLDIRMPGLDGYEVCRRLKQDERTAPVPVIFLSILEDDREKMYAFEMGCVDYINKPVRPAEALARVKTHLTLRRARLDLELRNAELEEARATLEARVRERSAELEQMNLRYRLGQTAGRIGTWEYDPARRTFWCSDEAKHICGFPEEQCCPTLDDVEECIPERQRVHRALDDLIQEGTPFNLVSRLRPADGSDPREISAVAELYRGPDSPAKVVGVIQDITERKKTEAVASTRLRMLEASYALDATLDDTLRWMLEEIEAQTASRIGFYHFVDEERQTVSLQAWSSNTNAMCSLEKKGSHYPMEQAGVWADCVREARPLIHNDYPSLPNRKGTPDGHPAVVRELVVPIIRNSRVVAIVGVGNKQSDYTETDLQVASLLGDFSWEIVIRKKAEESLRQSEEALRVREGMLRESQRVGEVGGWDWDRDSDVIWWSDELYRIYGLSPETPPKNYRDHLALYTPESAERLDAAVQRALKAGEPYELDLELACPTPKTRWIAARCQVKRGPDGAVAGLHGTVNNITQRKLVEKALKTLNQELDQRVRERTAQFEAKNAELERANKLFIGRELRMVELKERIRSLEGADC